MICPRCGKNNVERASYCGECGMKLPVSSGNTIQNAIKAGMREADSAAKAAGDGLQSIIDDIVHSISK